MAVRHRRALQVAVGSVGLAVGISHAAAQSPLRSFPEAEGFGSTVTGGRATSTIYHVTNLNDSGPGSFRDAVSSSNRIVVFDVAGDINLKSDVSAKSNLTLLGQTAPGAGISLDGYEVSFSSQSNEIVRYLRFRPGDGSPSSDDAVALYDSKNVILDHVSIEFAKYDNIDAVTDNHADPNITIQNSIIADPIGQQFGAHLEAVGGHFTVVNNLWANSHNRNPLAKVDEQYVDNVLYNFEAGYTTHTSTPFSHDLVNNTFIYGPATSGNPYYQLSSTDKFYATGNVRDTNKDGALNPSEVEPTTGTIVSKPNFASTASLPTLSSADAYQFVIAHAGASLSRDDLDNLVISQTQTLGSGAAGKGAGTAGPSGGLYSSASSTGLSNGGLGTTPVSSRPPGFDTDNDGVPDTWESAHGMNPANPADALKLNPLGYLMIEQYANELGSTNATTTWTAPAGNWNTPANWSTAAIPGPMDYAQIRGTAASNASVSLSSGTAVAMTLSIGGNGPATGAGESLAVSGSAALNVYDTLTVGDRGNASLAISGGSVSAYNLQLGNSLNGATSTGSLNLTAGTLSVSQLVLGAGSPGAWTTGGSMTWTAGTLKAANTLYVNVPIALGSAATLDSNGFDGLLAGTLSDLPASQGALTKIGAGTLTLAAANTYSGPTTIQSGALNLTGSLNHSPVTLANAATLAGTGSLLSLTANPASTVAPGTTTLGSLTILQSANIAGHLAIQLDATGAGSSDLLAVAGPLTLTNATLDLSLLPASPTPDDPAYILATYNTLTGAFATITNLPAGYSLDYAYDNGASTHNIALIPTPVPEPTTLALLALAATTTLTRRRRPRTAPPAAIQFLS